MHICTLENLHSGPCWGARRQEVACCVSGSRDGARPAAQRFHEDCPTPGRNQHAHLGKLCSRATRFSCEWVDRWLATPCTAKAPIPTSKAAGRAWPDAVPQPQLYAVQTQSCQPIPWALTLLPWEFHVYACAYAPVRH